MCIRDRCGLVAPVANPGAVIEQLKAVGLPAQSLLTAIVDVYGGWPYAGGGAVVEFGPTVERMIFRHYL